MGRKITVDIAATGSVDGSFTSSMNQLQQAMKTVKTEAKGAGDSFTQLTRQVSQQRSALKSLQTEYAVMMATGDTAGANQMLEQVITMQGALEQNKSIVEGVRQAMQGLSNIDAETASSISRLTTEINQQETELQQLQSAYDQAVQEYGEGSQEAQKLQTEIQQLTTKLDANKQSLTQQMDAAKQMAQGYQQVNSATKQLQSTISKQKTDLNQLKQAFVETALKEGQTSQSARELGAQIAALSSDLAANESAFKQASDAADSYDKSLQGAEKSANSKSWKNTAIGNLVSSGISRAADAMGDFGRGIFTTGMEFESQMAKVAGISGATDEQMADLTAAAKEWGGSTMYSAKEAGQALEYMALAGWDTEKSIDSLGPVLKLASGAGMDLGETSDLVTDFMGAFNKSSMSVQDFANKLVIASTSSNTSVSQMGEAFRNSAAGMNAMGQSVDTTSAVLSVLADNGIKGSRAGTQLSAIMRDMNHHMENGAIQIGKTSVAVADAQGNYRQLTDIIKDVDAATEGMSETERTAALSSIFTQDSQQGMFTLLDAQNGLLEDRQKLLANETMDQGALNKLYENQKKTFEYQWESFKGGVEDLQTSLFDLFKPAAASVLSFINDSVFPAFNSMIQWLQGIDWSNIFGGIKDFFSNIWDSLGDSGKNVLGGAGILGGVFAAFKGFGKVKDIFSNMFGGKNPFQSIIGGAKSAASQTQGIFASLGSGIQHILEGAGNAIKSVFEGIATLNIGSAAGFAIVVGSISLALAGLSAIGEPVLTFLHGLADVLLQLTGGLLDQFANFIQQVADVFPEFCAGLSELSPLIDSVGTAISNVITSIGDALATVLPTLEPLVSSIGATISSIVSTISDAIARVVEAIAPYIPEITNMINTITETIGKIADDITRIFEQVSPILDSLGNAFEKLGNAVRNGLDGVANIIHSVGDAIHEVFDGVADVVESVGHALEDAGKGFDNFAKGCQKLDGLNLFNIAAGLAAMLVPIGGLALESMGMSGLGDGMLHFAQGLQLLQSIGTDFTGIISGVQNLVSQLQTAAGSMETIGPQMASACQAIVAGVNSLSVGIMAGVATLSAAFASMISMFSTTFSSLVSTTSTGVQGVISALTGMTTGFSSAGTAIISIMSTVTTSIMNSCSRMRSTMQTTINSMVSTTNSGMSKIRSSVQSSFASIPGIVSSAMNSAVASVQSGVSAMAAALSVRLEGPHIAVPHFSMSGSFDPKTGAVPTVSVSYYKKGGIMDGSTIFGQNGNRLMVGGEAGQEAILPLDPFWNKLDSFLEQLRAMMRPSLFDMDEASLANAIGRGGGSYVSNPSLVFNPTININGNASDSSSISQQISDEIENQKQQLFEQLKTMMQEERERAFAYGF